MTQRYAVTMYGFGFSRCATEQSAKRALAKFRKQYRDSRASMPYPVQQITLDGKVIYRA